jgi:predicted helicase
MRYSLMKTFNEIYILNLHGSSLKKENTPSGGKDENVFDIQAGVAIAVMVKFKEASNQPKIKYFDLYGIRKEKYKFLETHDVKNTKWQELKPREPYYFFVPKKEKGRKKYEKFWKVTDIFPVNGVGIVTARDNFVIGNNKNILINKIRRFKNCKESDDLLHQLFQIRQKKGWSIRKAWNMLQEIDDGDLEDYVKPVLYRPFDEQWIFYHDSVVWRTVKKIMVHMESENLGLISTRFVFRKSQGFQHAFVTNKILDINQLQSPGTAQLFPLYLYNKEKTQKKKKKNPYTVMMVFDKSKHGYQTKKPNINPKLLEV